MSDRSGTLRLAKASEAACPLRLLTAAVIDTETTSLDVRKARAVEIGAVALIGGRLVRAHAFSELIDPGEAIPPELTAIHGISDAMVRGKPSFTEVHKRYAAFAGRHVVLGYALGYDLGVIKHELARAGQSWKAPRSLDVRELLRLIDRPPPDLALEKAAAWFGISAEGRHRALPDAQLTAALFLKLVPGLRDRGIRTLAEAEAACRRLTRYRESHAEAGWHEVVAARPQPRAASGEFDRVEVYPYRHHVADVMGSPAIAVAASATLHDALDILVGRKISSVFVDPVSDGAPHGILTERDIMRALKDDPRHGLARPVTSAASFPLETVSAGDFLYSAFGRMRRRGYRHLGVVDETGRLVGALTQRDLLRQRADEAIALTDGLDEAVGVHELAEVWRKLSAAAGSLVAEDVDPRDIAAIISSEVRGLTARAAAIAERELGEGPGVKYAVMVLGSAGRGESLLAMDQDNAIIYEAGEPEEAQDLWLKQAGIRMNAILDEVGVPLCKGGVMAGNDAWRKPVAGWRRQVASWLSRSEPQDILNADIFFDAVPVHGSARLADDLRRDAIDAASASTLFLKLMALNAVNVTALTGWFGRWRMDEDGRMDLKRGGIMPIFSAARVLALKHRTLQRSTAARLGALRGEPDIPARAIDTLLEAHRILLGAVLRQQLADIAAGIPPSNRVDPKSLAGTEQEHLRWALEQVPAVRDLLGDPLG